MLIDQHSLFPELRFNITKPLEDNKTLFEQAPRHPEVRMKLERDRILIAFGETELLVEINAESHLVVHAYCATQDEPISIECRHDALIVTEGE